MIRELAQIILAIHLIHPKFSEPTNNYYAKIIEIQANKIDIDPLVFVSIIEHESQWKPTVISADGADYGMMQIRARYYGGKPEWLFNPEINIRAGGYIIKKSIEVCRNYLHREPEYQEWMSCYQGSCSVGYMCKPTKLTQVFQDYQECLENDLLVGKDASECHKIYERK